MASVTKTPDAYGQYGPIQWDGWKTSYVSTAQLTVAPKDNQWGAYRVDFPAASTLYTASLEVRISFRSQATFPATMRCSLYRGDNPQTDGNRVATQTFQISNNSTVTHRFQFNGLSLININKCCFKLEGTTNALYATVTAAVAVVDYVLPALGFTAAPSVLTVGEKVRLSFTNRLSQNITVNFSTASTLLKTVTASGDTLDVECPLSWFTTAGITGNSMRVDVDASDNLGRTASANITLNKQQASSVTPTAPKSTSVSGSESIPFAWEVDESLAPQTRAELQWSTDGANWSALANISGGAKTYTAGAYRFPVGTIYWRVRVTNSYDITSAWASANFTVSYAGLAISATPSAVNMGKTATLAVSNRLNQTITLQFTSGATPLDTKTLTSDSINVTFPAEWFRTAGVTGTSLQVDITATDPLGRTSTLRVPVTKTAITLGVSPASLFVGSNVTATVGNSAGRPYQLQFVANNTVLYDKQSDADGQFITTAAASWFTQAGITADSMTVQATVRDDLDRTATASFTLKKQKASTATPTAPKSTSVNGSVAVTFTWAVDETEATQTKAELQWRAGGSSWTALGTVDGNAKILSAPAYLFKAGSVNWRVRVTNSWGLVSAWSSASFTVTYDALSVSAAPSTVDMGKTVKLTFTNRLSRKLTLEYKAGATVLKSGTLSADSATVTFPAAWFADAGATGTSLQVDVTATDDLGRTATARVTMSKTPITVGVTPSAVYTDQKVTVTTGNTAGRTYDLVVKYNTTVLYSLTGTGDGNRLITCPASWFTTAGVTGDSLSVAVSVSDDLGRMASASFTVKKKKASTTTATAPKSTSVSGSRAIAFSWTVDETEATQTRAELQWRAGGSSWTALGTVDGSAQTFSAPAYLFKVGSVEWRVRSTNSWGLVSAWSSASFTVTYAALSITATPSTVDMGKTVKLAFANRLSRKLTLQYKAGATVLKSGTLSADSTTVTFPASWFVTAGVTGASLQVDVTVSDDLGRTATVRVTMSKTPITIAAAPASLYTGEAVTVTLGNTAGRTYGIVFRSGSATLHTVTGTGDGNRTVTCPAAWFATAGVSGSSMRVDVVVTDDLSRSASASFTLINPQGSTATPVAPKSTGVAGDSAINFAWTVSTDWGSQKKAELQWSTDNAVWTDLASVNGTATTWTAPAVKFPAGVIYWRVRVTNSFGVLGNWSASVNFTVAYAAISQAVPVNSPTSGIINAAAVNTFAVGLQATGPVYEPFTVSAASFFWRADETADYTELPMTPAGTTAYVTIPAGTFPTGELQWYATATDNTGAERSTAVFLISALNAVVEATPISPASTTESGGGPIVFRWSYGSLDGSPQSAAQIQWSSDGTSWILLATVTGADPTWTAPAETFEAGVIFWRVRSANAVGTWGPWSDAVSFVCFSPPRVVGVTGNGVPFLTVSWQTSGQLAYEIDVDGTVWGPFFGESARSYTLPRPIADGPHTVKVRAQNRYGLWSQWAVGSVNVQNVPGSAITLTAEGGVNAALTIHAAILPPAILEQTGNVQGTSGEVTVSITRARTTDSCRWYYRTPGGAWKIISGTAGAGPAYAITCSQANDRREYRCRVYNAVGEVYSLPVQYRYIDPTIAFGETIVPDVLASTGYFLIYRDGALIGKTYTDYIDRTALGTHEYFALQVLPGGYYTRSNTVTVTTAVSCPMIAPLAGGDFLRLRLSESAHRAEGIKRDRQTVAVQYAGAVYPEEEVGEHESLVVSFDAAWLHTEAAGSAAFEAMLGTAVILKTPGGQVAVGVLSGFDRRDPRFYRAYSASIRQMHREEFADA